jgi:hypothetical protein
MYIALPSLWCRLTSSRSGIAEGVPAQIPIASSSSIHDGSFFCHAFREFRKTKFSGAGRFLAAERQEVLGSLNGLGYFAEQLLQVFVAVDEIDF